MTYRDGKIIARSIIRLLWDNSAGRPVLFQELIYPKIPLEAAITTALNKAMKRRASELNLPLLSGMETDSPYPNSVSSLGGRAPSEYVDALQGRYGNSWNLNFVYYVK